MKILGIDDNPDINKLMAAIIRSEGHEFVEVSDGKTGLELIRKENFDLVFLDIAMPEFSGKDVLDALVSEDIVTKQPIYLFTASSVSDEEVNQLIAKGAKSCLRKPVSVDKILETLNSVKKE